jgi:hypothetical protein
MAVRPGARRRRMAPSGGHRERPGHPPPRNGGHPRGGATRGQTAERAADTRRRETPADTGNRQGPVRANVPDPPLPHATPVPRRLAALSARPSTPPRGAWGVPKAGPARSPDRTARRGRERSSGRRVAPRCGEAPEAPAGTQRRQTQTPDTQKGVTSRGRHGRPALPTPRAPHAPPRQDARSAPVLPSSSRQKPARMAYLSRSSIWSSLWARSPNRAAYRSSSPSMRCGMRG